MGRISYNLAPGLQREEAGFLRFLTALRAPPTNNERDLPMAKLRQKISGGFLSEQGAHNFAVLRAAIAIARKQNWNTFNTQAHPDPCSATAVFWASEDERITLDAEPMSYL